MKRLYWWLEGLDEGKFVDNAIRKPSYPDLANLVSSLTDEGLHMPALDIDVPMRVVESTTPGHHHLFFDVACPWEHYRAFLEAAARCGILEHEYVSVSIRRGATFLRTQPTKPPDDPPSGGSDS